MASLLPSSHGLSTSKISLEAVKPPVILLAAVANRNVEQGKASGKGFPQDWYIYSNVGRWDGPKTAWRQ